MRQFEVADEAVERDGAVVEVVQAGVVEGAADGGGDAGVGG